MGSGTKWSEEETILVFYYYCQMPFGKISSRNPEIIRIAELLGRTPGAVSFKMGNLGHFDPALQARNVNGLSNASKLDEEIVNRFRDDWESLSAQAQKYEAALREETIEQLLDIEGLQLPEGLDREIITTNRINQEFFRNSVLNSYGNACCITGIQIPTLLVASHIKPWKDSDHKTERTNPCNGLCLNALHDKAFDKGLITVLPDYTIRVSSQLKGDDAGASWIRACDKQQIRKPEKFLPAKEFLEYHNDIIFIR